MASISRGLLLFIVVLGWLHVRCLAVSEKDIIRRIQTAPRTNLENAFTEGTDKQAGFDGFKDTFQQFSERKVDISRVSVSTVAWLTLAMAAATGLGAVPFFFVELEQQWAGVCNGMAAGVMLAASFDLIQEGQVYGHGNLVVIGILAGGIFIWLCKKTRDKRRSSMIQNKDEIWVADCHCSTHLEDHT